VRITGLHVDGFGRFHDYRIDDLSQQLTVVHGPNEAGKSTLLAFVRGVLFGFPGAKAADRRFEPVAGGNLGGRLFIEDDHGGAWIVERTGRGKGKLLVTAPNGLPGSEADLSALLGGADRDLFENIFAFSVAELDSFKALSASGVRDRIFASVATGAGRSPGEVASDLSRSMEVLLRPRAASVIRDAIEDLEAVGKRARQAREEAKGYASLIAEEKAAEESLSRLRQEEGRLRAELAFLERTVAAWPDWLDRQRTLAKLAEFDAVPEVPESMGEELEGLLSSLREEEARLDEKRKEVARLEERRGRISVDEALAASYQDVQALSAGLSRYEGDREDLARLEATIDELQRRHAREFFSLSSLPGGPSGLEPAELDERERSANRLRSLLHEREDASKRASEARRILQDRQRDLGLAELGRAGGPSRVQLLVAAAAFAAGALVSAVTGSFVGAVMLGLAAAAALWAGARAGTAGTPGWYGESATRLKDLVSTAEVDERAAQAALEELGRQVRSLAGDLGLPEDPTYGDVEAFLQMIGRCREERRLLDQCEERRMERDGVKERVDAFEQSAAQVLARFGIARESGPELRLRVEKLRNDCEQDANARKDLAGIEEGLEGARRDVAESEDRLASLNARVEELVQSVGAFDVEVLKKFVSASAERRELTRSASEAEKRLEQRIGRGGEVASVLAELETGDLPRWQARVAELQTALEELEGQVEEAVRKHQRLLGDRESLERSSDVASFDSQAEVLRERLAEAARRWLELALAKKLVEQTAEQFRERNQPRVVTRAKDLFEQVTEGRYVRVAAGSDGGDSLSLVDKDGRSLPAVVLSTGAAQQLYLCLRIGLAEEFGSRGVALPLVMDEVLATFDPRRADAVAGVLASVAKTRQVVLMTCHPETVARLELAADRFGVGVRVVEVET